MKKIPKEAKEHVDYLNRYEVNDDLKTCHLVQLYDTGEYGAQKNGQSIGFVDSKIFDVWAFNNQRKIVMTKREIRWIVSLMKDKEFMSDVGASFKAKELTDFIYKYVARRNARHLTKKK